MPWTQIPLRPWNERTGQLSRSVLESSLRVILLRHNDRIQAWGDLGSVGLL